MVSDSSEREGPYPFFGKSKIIPSFWVMDISPVSKDELILLSNKSFIC